MRNKREQLPSMTYARLAAFALSLLFVLYPAGRMAAQIPETVLDPINYPSAILEIEALYQNHKTISSALIARTAQEEANEILHTLVKDNTGDYAEINLELDKYSRMFDWIDLLVNSLHSALHAKRSIENIGSLAEEYARIIKDFAREVKDTKVIRLNDTKIIDLFGDAVEGVTDDCNSMYSSFLSLSMYVVPVPGTGHESAARCNPHTLYLILDEIDTFLTSLEDRLHRLVDMTNIYILERKGYWHEEVMRVERGQIALEALERWKGVNEKLKSNKEK